LFLGVKLYYRDFVNNECSFLIFTGNGNGPFKNLDLRFCFFVIITPEFELKFIIDWSLYFKGYLDLTNQDLTISPLMLYLYLKPLYSNLGGSTTLADDFIIKPGFVTFR